MAEALKTGARLRVVDDPQAVIDEHASARLDTDWRDRLGGWENPVTGMGTRRDKTQWNEFRPGGVMRDMELSAIYHNDDLAARMVDIVPDEMLREGFLIDAGDPELNDELNEKSEQLGLVDKLADALRWGRLYGGGALLLGADDGRSAATPLMPERAQGLTYTYVFDRRYLFPLSWYRDVGNPKLGEAETYMVTSPAAYADAPVSIVHESRLVLFDGATTGIRERQINFGWDLSVLQRVSKILGEFNLGWNAVSVLLQDGNQAVFKMAGLADAIASGQGDALQQRMKAIDEARSVVGAIVIDAGGNAEDQTEESFERQHFPMTGIPETLDRLCLRLAAALQIPVTILMGQSPSGMNATGQSDFQWFYDRIRSNQNRKLAGKIRRIAKVILATKDFGDKIDRVGVKFPPLWTEPPLTRAQTRYALLQGDALALTGQSLTPAEHALSRFRPDGFEQEIQLSDDAKKAREDELKVDLTEIAKGSFTEPAPPPTGGNAKPPQQLKGEPPALEPGTKQPKAGTE
jgi:phage-related protein (TIGR01555 family)